MSSVKKVDSVSYPPRVRCQHLIDWIPSNLIVVLHSRIKRSFNTENITHYALWSFCVVVTRGESILKIISSFLTWISIFPLHSLRYIVKEFYTHRVPILRYLVNLSYYSFCRKKLRGVGDICCSQSQTPIIQEFWGEGMIRGKNVLRLESESLKVRFSEVDLNKNSRVV